MPKLPSGITGKTRTDGSKGAMKGHSELPCSPKTFGESASLKGYKSGKMSAGAPGMPLGEKLTPKHKGGEYA